MKLSKNTIIQLFRNNVKRAERVRKGVYNGRCSMCGDSEKSRSKKRLYLLCSSAGKPPTVYCHNCGRSMRADKFLKRYFPAQWESAVELNNGSLFSDNNDSHDNAEEGADSRTDNEWIEESEEFFSSCCIPLQDDTDSIEISRLQDKALSYLKGRKIPEKFYRELYVCYTGKYAGRLIFPFVEEWGRIYYFQARDLFNRKIKYLSRDFVDGERAAIYRFYRVDVEQRVYITEGLIDCLYLPNSVALCGTGTSGEVLGRLDDHFEEMVFVTDNDSSGKKLTKKLLKNGYKCFVWPDKFYKYKDIGEIVEAGVDLESLHKFVDENTCRGIKGIAKI